MAVMAMTRRFGSPHATASTRARRIRISLRTGALLTDFLVITASVLIAYRMRTALTWLPEVEDLGKYVYEIIPWVYAVWIASIAAFAGYSTRYYGAGIDEYRKVLYGSLTAAGVTGTLNYLMKYELSRPFFVLLFAVGVVGILLGRFTFRKVIQSARKNGHLTRRVLIAGAPIHVDEVAQTFRRESWLGLQVIGAISSSQPVGTSTRGGVEILGSEKTLADTVIEREADLLIFVQGAARSAQDFRRIAWDLEEMHVSTAVVPALTDIAQDRVRLRPLAGLPIVHVEPPRAIEATRFGKRAFDVLGAALSLLLLSPVIAAVAVTVALGDRGPIIFRQTRIGRDGEPFDFLKFRTMVPGAEALQPALETERESNEVLFKMRRDPRTTRPGYLLRRYSLDELPQLVNVLRGDMSLVGPRPALPQEVARYDDDARRRLRVRPGLTGLWQVSGRSDLSWEETVRLDVYYVDNWSFVQDLAIMVKTVRAVISGTGAY